MHAPKAPGALAVATLAAALAFEPATGATLREAGPPDQRDTYSLDQAARLGLVEYTVVGTGASSGDALLLRIRRTSNRTIVVVVDPGTLLGPSDRRFQRMVVSGVRGLVTDEQDDAYIETDTIRLDDGRPRVYVLEAYCMDFTLENPTPAVSFAPVGVDARAAVVMDAARDSGLSIAATQVALWMDRGHVTREQIETKFDASDQEQDDAWELLKRLPPP